MSNEFEYFKMLQNSVQQKHNCGAVHSETAFVHEMVGGQTIWRGNVEVFDLVGHAKAEKCYAWVYHENDQNSRFVMVLGRDMVTSPEMAVKSAIFFDAQPVPYPRPNIFLRKTPADEALSAI